MSAEDNKRTAQEAYAAFGKGDAEGAMRNIDDSATWKVRGDNSLTGTHTGKAEIGALWGKLAEKGFSNEPHEFIADGDKVVVLSTNTLDGESADVADVLTYDSEGKLVAFESRSDQTIANRVFAR